MFISGHSFFETNFTRDQVVNAVTLDCNNGIGDSSFLNFKEVLSFDAREFIREILLPYLKVTEDNPDNLKNVIKAMFNVIYFFELMRVRPGFAYTLSDSENNPDLRAACNWFNSYRIWCNNSGIQLEGLSICMVPSTIPDLSLQSFGSCLLTAASLPNNQIFIMRNKLENLQIFARHYNLIEISHINYKDEAMNDAESRKRLVVGDDDSAMEVDDSSDSTDSEIPRKKR